MIQINVTEAAAPKNAATLDRPDLNLVGNTYSKEQTRTEISKVFSTAIRGEATPTSSPTTWNSGNPDLFEKWEVHTAGTYVNFKDSGTNAIIVSPEDLAGRFVYIEVSNGVSKKIVTQFQTVAGSTNIPDWTASIWTAGSMVIKDNIIWKATEQTTAEQIPGLSNKWVAKIENKTDPNMETILQSFLVDSFEVVPVNTSGSQFGTLYGDGSADNEEFNKYIEIIPLAGASSILYKAARPIGTQGTHFAVVIKMTDGTYRHSINAVSYNTPQTVYETEIALPTNCQWIRIGYSNYDVFASQIVDFKYLIGVKTSLVFPLSGEVDGKVYSGGFNQIEIPAGASGIIPMVLMSGKDKIAFEGLQNQLGNTLYLGKKNADGSNVQLILANGDLPNDFSSPKIFDIDHTAQYYFYSILKGDSKITLYSKKSVDKEDAVKKYIDLKIGSGGSGGGLNYGEFKPEDYGAERLDPLNPDAGKDCTQAFNDMFFDMFSNHQGMKTYTVIMSGVYNIAGVPSALNGQINIPFKSLDWDWRSVQFKGVTKHYPISGLGIPKNGSTPGKILPLIGCGFYCSYIYTGSEKRSIIRISEGTHYGQKMGHIDFGDIVAYVKNHDSEINAIKNNMGCFDLSNLNTACFGDMFLTTTVLSETIGPDLNSVGIYMPKKNNMASVHGRALKTQGFGIGSILTEHMDLGQLLAVFNRIGTQIQETYPVNIGNSAFEMNAVHCELVSAPGPTPGSAYVNFGVFQTEDYLDTPVNRTHWYWGGRNNMINGNGRAVCGIVACHQAGGGRIPFSGNAHVRFLMGEQGEIQLS